MVLVLHLYFLLIIAAGLDQNMSLATCHLASNTLSNWQLPICASENTHLPAHLASSTTPLCVRCLTMKFLPFYQCKDTHPAYSPLFFYRFLMLSLIFPEIVICPVRSQSSLIFTKIIREVLVCTNLVLECKRASKEKVSLILISPVWLFFPKWTNKQQQDSSIMTECLSLVSKLYLHTGNLFCPSMVKTV